MANLRRSAAASAITAVIAGGVAGCVGPFADRTQGESRNGSSSGKAASVATAAPAKMIARATFDSPQAKGAKVQIGVVSLKVTGKLADLTLSITPNVPGVAKTNVYRLVGEHSPDVALVDTVNLKRHVVVRDSSGSNLQPDYIGVGLANGQPTLQNYTFAAPPAHVKTVNVHFGPFPPFRDVPVER